MYPIQIQELEEQKYRCLGKDQACDLHYDLRIIEGKPISNLDHLFGRLP